MSQTIVKALYNYDSTTERGHGIHVLAGEKFRLISDENEHWWYVSKTLPAENGFYLPKSYLKVLSVEENDCNPPADHNHHHHQHSSLWSLNDDFHEGNDSDVSEYSPSVPFGCLSESRRVSASIP
ncbi:SH3 1 domain containing protein, partial [Trichuris trichiura]